MKKRVLSLLLSLAFCLSLLPAISAADVEYVTVTFDANGGYFWNDPNTTVDTEQAKKGDTSTVNGEGPGTPTREDYEFVGWYLTADGSGDRYDPWNYEPTYLNDTTFYAKWKPFIPSGTCGENLTWSFNKDTGKLTITGSGAMEDYDLQTLPPWYSVWGQITNIALPNGLTTIGELAFFRCTALTSVPLPNGLTSIGASAFFSCGALTSITFPDTLESIGNEAFTYTGLTSVTIPSSVTEIQGHPFAGCADLTTIKVSSENSEYVSDQGVLFTKDKTHLMAFPADHAATSYSIPATVTMVRSYAFFRCTKLTHVNIPDSVTTIGWSTFRVCTSLSSLTLGKNVKEIGGSTFSECSSLTDVYYQGTEAQRTEIDIGSNNGPLLNATWHYGEQAPTVEPTSTPEPTPAPTAQAPTIAAQPKDAKAKSGAKAKFTVKVKEKNVSYQWYEKAPDAADWAVMNGETKNALTVTASGANNGYQYRCLVKNKAGGQVYSNAATLTVTLQPPVIKTQPKDANVKSGAKAKLSVKATGKNIAYTWYERENAESEWKAVAGGNKNTLQVTASKANDGHQFYCHLENGDGQADSKTVTLTVKTEAPTIKTQPKSLTVKSGKKAKLSVKATGKNLKYQWFERANADAEWTEVTGGNKSSLQIAATKAKDGHQFYCHVSNGDGAVDSAIATLTVTPEAPKFTTQPKDAKVKIGAKAKFKVKATPKNVSYQWYYRENETAEWKLIDGATKATYEIKAAEGNVGWQFRCLAKNDDGEAWSKVATLLQK